MCVHVCDRESMFVCVFVRESGVLVCVCLCCVICEEGEGDRVGEKVGSDRAGRAFVNITRAASQHSCSPILGTDHAPASVRRRVFLSTACIISIYLPVIREVPISFIV